MIVEGSEFVEEDEPNARTQRRGRLSRERTIFAMIISIIIITIEHIVVGV